MSFDSATRDIRINLRRRLTVKNIALSVYLPLPVTGQQIIDAVELAVKDRKEFPAVEFVKEENWDADSEAYTIGQTSKHPAYHLVIKVGEHFSRDSVRPDGRYVSLAVANHFWGGMLWGLGYGDRDIVKALESFQSALIGSFTKAFGISSEAIMEKTEECRGSGISDIRFVCSFCGTGLKENPGKCPSCGAPLGALPPIY